MDHIWMGLVNTLPGLFSFAVLIACWEWHRTTVQLRNTWRRYVKAVEDTRQNPQGQFDYLRRIREYEFLLRRVHLQRPRTPGAYRRAEQVLHTLLIVHFKLMTTGENEPVPLAKLDEFPVPSSENNEELMTEAVLRSLRKIKWLRIESASSRRRYS